MWILVVTGNRNPHIMKRFFVFFLIVITVVAVSCSKHSSGPDAGHGPNALFPLTAGDTWNYQDSVFTDFALSVAYADTMTVNGQLVQDNSGNWYVGLPNPYVSVSVTDILV